MPRLPSACLHEAPAAEVHDMFSPSSTHANRQNTFKDDYHDFTLACQRNQWLSDLCEGQSVQYVRCSGEPVVAKVEAVSREDGTCVVEYRVKDRRDAQGYQLRKGHVLLHSLAEMQSFEQSAALTCDEFLSFDTYVFACDGVILGIADQDTRTSVATVNYLLGLDKRVMFVTNNSNKSRAQFVKQLENVGISFQDRSSDEKAQMVISSAYATAAWLRRKGLRRPFLITSDVGLLRECRLAGITEYFATVTEDGKIAPEFESADMRRAAEIVRSHPDVDCIVVGWDLQLTALKVATAVNYIQWHEDLHSHEKGYQPMPLVAAAGDSGGVLGSVDFHGTCVKQRAVGNGAMADIIARSFDPPREWIDMGKPSEAMVKLLKSSGAYTVDCSRALMVGDTLQTDIAFGHRCGMSTLLVLSGVTTASNLDSVMNSGKPLHRPHFVLPKLGAFVASGELPPAL